MYFVSTKDRQLEFGYFCSDMALQDDLFLSISLYKRNKEEWFKIRQELNLTYNPLEFEYIRIQFENEEATNFQEKGECLRILTTHLNLLTFDKYTVYIAAIEVAKALNSKISEDDTKAWLNPESN